MEKPLKEWSVWPHCKLTRLDDNLLSIARARPMRPRGDGEGRMTVVRLKDGRLVLFGAIVLDEAEMRAIKTFGTPAYLIVPNDMHRVDAKVWKDLYPAIKVIAPAAARARVEKIVPVDATVVDFHDPAVRFVPVPGTGEQEAALVVQTGNGTTLVLNDLIFNLENRTGREAERSKAAGAASHEPHVSPFVRMRKVKDKGALKAQLERWSRLPDLKRVIISHGNIIADDAAHVLRRIAEDLAA